MPCTEIVRMLKRLPVADFNPRRFIRRVTNDTVGTNSKTQPADRYQGPVKAPPTDMPAHSSTLDPVAVTVDRYASLPYRDAGDPPRFVDEIRLPS